MNEQDDNEGTVGATVNAVTGLVKAVPIYKDAIQPAAREVGKTLETLAKTVNLALAPVSGLVWGYDKIKDFVHNKVSEKLQNTPEEDIVTPPQNVAGPVLESLRYTGSIDELKEMYANLLASSMDKKTTHTAHPAFVEIIKQLSPDEAKMLNAITITDHGRIPVIHIRNDLKDGSGGRIRYLNFTRLGDFSGVKELHLVPNYLDNLCRLGLIQIPDNSEILIEGIYKWLEEHPSIKSMKDSINLEDGRKSTIIRTRIRVTDFGSQFINTCVLDHRKSV